MLANLGFDKAVRENAGLAVVAVDDASPPVSDARPKIAGGKVDIGADERHVASAPTTSGQPTASCQAVVKPGTAVRCRWESS